MHETTVLFLKPVIINKCTQNLNDLKECYISKDCYNSKNITFRYRKYAFCISSVLSEAGFRECRRK